MANGEVRSISFSWISKVLEADPEFYADRKNELLYEFTDRDFRGDPRKVATAYPDE